MVNRRGASLALVLLAVLASIAGCRGEQAVGPSESSGIGSDVSPNLFRNGSFEAGPDPWLSLTTAAWGTPFRVGSEVAHSGSESAFLELRAAPNDTGTKVFGVVQEVQPGQFPELISGYYYVKDWVRGTPKQYLQFVVIAFAVDNLPGGFANHQIRYPLGGIAQDPFAISNAKFRYVSKEPPVLGRWVYFERPVRQDFEELWGAVPEGYDKLRILFEVRYDDKAAGTEAKADVFFDDLYLGSSKDNPNRP